MTLSVLLSSYHHKTDVECLRLIKLKWLGLRVLFVNEKIVSRIISKLKDSVLERYRINVRHSK